MDLQSCQDQKTYIKNLNSQSAAVPQIGQPNYWHFQEISPRLIFGNLL